MIRFWNLFHANKTEVDRGVHSFKGLSFSLQSPFSFRATVLYFYLSKIIIFTYIFLFHTIICSSFTYARDSDSDSNSNSDNDA